jgi:hypothetical protein
MVMMKRVSEGYMHDISESTFGNSGKTSSGITSAHYHEPKNQK